MAALPPSLTPHMPEHPNRPSRLRIWQQNLNKSLDAQLDLLHAANPDDYDLLLLQEPFLDHLNLTRANYHWTVVYPTRHHDDEARSRSIILVSRKLSTGAWIPIPIPSPDLTAITLFTNSAPVHIFNAYIEGDKDHALHALSRATQRLTPEVQEGRVIWAGDFNRHHPLWDSEENNHLFTTENLDRAQVLLNKVAEFGLEMVLPQGIPTLEAARSKNLTRPDNVFCSDSITDAVIACNTAPELRPTKTDHMPVHTVIDLTIDAAEETPRRNYKDVDWDDFQATLAEELAERPIPDDILTEADFNNTLTMLMDALQRTIERHVPFSKPIPFAKRWWTKELGAMRQKVLLLGRAAYKHRSTPFHPAQCDYRTARNRYADKIRAAKKEHWEAWLDEADKYTVWNVNRFVKGGPTDGGRLRVPPLKVDGSPDRTSNDDKSKLLYQTFFPPPGPPQPPRPNHKYPKPAFQLRPITNEQLEETIRKLKQYKAPGPDGIPNEVYIHCADTLIPILGRLFRASFALKIYPDEWKTSNTVVLRKPDRPRYDVAKAYRPIALINCIAKILSACVTSELVYEAERHSLLVDHHYGGRPGRTTTDSLHLITKTVKDAWRSGKVTSILFLDIKAAFPSADPECLFHDMRMRGVPVQLMEWLREKLRGRKTKLMFDDYASDPFEIHSGIDQGCPLSVILYQFYNSDLVSSARLKDGELAVGTMDDVAVIATGKTFEETHDKLRSFMTRRKGALTWSQTHNSEFSFDKLGLLNCSGKLKDLGPSLQMNDTVVKPSHHHKFLGVLLDHKLYFHEHVAYALAKGTSWVAQFRRLAKSRYGLTFGLVKRLYLAVAVPSMLYAADIFLTPVRMLPEGKRLHGSVGAIRKLERVQRQALLIMTGAMRTTATDVMCAHANLLPFTLLIDKICHRAITRICTLPKMHPLHRHVRWAGRKLVANHRSALTELVFAYNIHIERTETISPIRFHPRWHPPHKTQIASDKEAAIRDEGEWSRRPGLRVYSDGSDLDGGVGAAAVLFKPGRPGYKVLRYHLGSSDDHSVYEAEVVGLLLGTELLKAEEEVEDASIATDNKSSLQATKLRQPAPGHYLLDRLHRHLCSLGRKHQDATVTLRWVPGHVDLEGNDTADLEAKRAARGDSSPAGDLPLSLREGLPRSATKMKQTFLADLQEKAKTAWTTSRRSQKLARLDKCIPSKKYEKLIGKLPRRQANILFQLRTEHVPLQKHLHRIRKAESPICPSCHAAPETVHHFLLTCPAHARHRWEHFDRSLGRAGRSLSCLLNSPTALKPLFNYINATGRLSSTFGDTTGGKHTARQPAQRSTHN